MNRLVGSTSKPYDIFVRRLLIWLKMNNTIAMSPSNSVSLCMPGRNAVLAQNVRDVAVAEIVEELVADDDRAGARQDEQEHAAVGQPAGQGRHERRNPDLRHQEAGERPCRNARPANVTGITT